MSHVGAVGLPYSKVLCSGEEVTLTLFRVQGIDLQLLELQ